MPGDALRKELEVDCVLFDGGNIRGSDGNFENVEICAGRISRNLGEEKLRENKWFSCVGFHSSRFHRQIRICFFVYSFCLVYNIPYEFSATIFCYKN